MKDRVFRSMDEVMRTFFPRLHAEEQRKAAEKREADLRRQSWELARPVCIRRQRRDPNHSWPAGPCVSCILEMRRKLEAERAARHRRFTSATPRLRQRTHGP